MKKNNFDTWIFDLDNTLYSAETGIFDQVDKLMGEYIVKYLNVEISKAKIICSERIFKNLQRIILI